MRGRFDAEESQLDTIASGLSAKEQEDIIADARRGDIAAVEQRLDRGLNVDFKAIVNGESLLMASASSGNSMLVDMLLRKGAKADAVDHRNRNALAYCAEYSKVGVLLASRGADLTRRDSETDSTPLHLFAAQGHVFTDIMRSVGTPVDLLDGEGYTPLHRAAEMGRAVACEALVAMGAKINAVTQNTEQQTALHLAALSTHGTDAVRALLKSGAIVDAKNGRGQTPLHAAAVSGIAGNVLVICESVGGKNKIETTDKEGYSPLHRASLIGRLGAVRALMTQGADVNAITENSLACNACGLALLCGREGHSSVLYLSKKNGLNLGSRFGEMQLSPMHLAAQGGCVDSLKYLVDLSGTQVKSRQQSMLLNVRDKLGRPPLMHAIEKGKHQAVAALLSMHADPLNDEYYDTKKGQTCLHAACALPSGAAEVFEILINEAGYDIREVDKNGDSCMHLAAEAGNIAVIQKLLVLGMSANERNVTTGRLPLHNAAAFGKLDACSLLIGAGAAVSAMTSDTQGNTPISLAQYFGHSDVVELLESHTS